MEVMQLPGEQHLLQQCFENYCLLYDPLAAEGMKVRMQPLGEEYLEKFPPDEALELQNLFSEENILLTASVDKPTIGEKDTQTVRMVVEQKLTGKPFDRVEGTLVVSFPDKPSVRYAFPPPILMVCQLWKCHIKRMSRMARVSPTRFA